MNLKFQCSSYLILIIISYLDPYIIISASHSHSGWNSIRKVFQCIVWVLHILCIRGTSLHGLIYVFAIWCGIRDECRWTVCWARLRASLGFLVQCTVIGFSLHACSFLAGGSLMYFDWPSPWPYASNSWLGRILGTYQERRWWPVWQCYTAHCQLIW